MLNYQLSDVVEYRVRSHINIYDSPKCDRLATQASQGRHLRVLNQSSSEVNLDTNALMVRLCEDDYPGWLDFRDVDLLEVTETVYHPLVLSEFQIREKLPIAITFAREAMNQSNYYLWGGTVGPNYDCSGLIQAAFVAAGIWLPRDAYQQEAFTKPISISAVDTSCTILSNGQDARSTTHQVSGGVGILPAHDKPIDPAHEKPIDKGARCQLEPGDLVFFGTPQKATHVGLYLGDDRYIHSSGQAQGRNGIGIDVLSEDGDRVSQVYYHQLRGYGKVVASYQPGNRE
ncbi:C40 family peptidase [Microcoleus sp. LEGE 07076]|uniref:C40 family peptidase n=1 Tax=Microcoleus sp. LEGE 07076 TaxID=915322 RepID=UPI00187FA292|nr:C40 family peptidase [Microcoleus sp. LEGE 07076]MBE9187711.1 C40 family peptidase [Microcoleus sp. LEGE 07076]